VGGGEGVVVIKWFFTSKEKGGGKSVFRKEKGARDRWGVLIFEGEGGVFFRGRGERKEARCQVGESVCAGGGKKKGS